MAKRKPAKPKFKVGDLVYSYQNPTKKARVSHVFPSTEVGFEPNYKLALHDTDGYSYSSKYIGQKSLSKRKQR